MTFSDVITTGRFCSNDKLNEVIIIGLMFYYKSNLVLEQASMMSQLGGLVASIQGDV